MDAENRDTTVGDSQIEQELKSDSVTGADETSDKIRRRTVRPPTWPKIHEGAVGTAAAVGAWKTVTHSGRKI